MKCELIYKKALLRILYFYTRWIIFEMKQIYVIGWRIRVPISTTKMLAFRPVQNAVEASFL